MHHCTVTSSSLTVMTRPPADIVAPAPAKAMFGLADRQSVRNTDTISPLVRALLKLNLFQ